MSRVSVEISRKSLYSGKMNSAKRNVYFDKSVSADIHVALDFLYRFFSAVVLNV